MKIIGYSGISVFWHLARKWFERQLELLRDFISGLIEEKVSPYLYEECSNADIDRMFEATNEDGYILIPRIIIESDGSIKISVFEALTGLTPIE